MDEELEKVRKMFEEKIKEEETKFQQQQLYIGDACQKLLRNKAMADVWVAMDKSLPEEWSVSTLGSSQGTIHVSFLNEVNRMGHDTVFSPCLHFSSSRALYFSFRKFRSGEFGP
jgi:hypothetical protein